MDKETFMNYMNRIIRTQELKTDISRAAATYSNYGYDYYCSIMFPDLGPEMIELMEIILNDTDHWLSYWVYELHCGKTFRPGCVTYKEQSINLKTVDDLWDFIQEYTKNN